MRSVPPLARLFAAFACALAAWLVTAPASARAAGLCSKHASSEVAPPPLLMPLMLSLEQGDDACGPRVTREVVQRGDERVEISSSKTPAVLSEQTVLSTQDGEQLFGSGDTTRSRAGVHRSLDRPPRR